MPLTQQEAIDRRAILELKDGNYNIEYELTLTLRKIKDKISPEEKENFEGCVKILFDYEPKESCKDKILFLNFVGKIHSFYINDVKIDNYKFESYKLFLDTSKFNAGRNTILLLYSCEYNRNGVGLHAFTDPSDNRDYLYTQMEPYDCHRLLPCFDQPDLKAKLRLRVLAPHEWIVLGNAYERDVKEIKDEKEISERFNFSDEIITHLMKNHNIVSKGYKIYDFNETPRISTYLYALCAGEYHCIENTLESPTKLRLFMRQSLRDCGEPEELFKVTIAGMKFYKDYFGCPFPFGKYDQIFCPEYNYGAMENVGLITHNEFYCWKSKPTHNRRTGFAITVLHELAHMWFGNMVTMKWWDDLWLNESFATFISHLCLSKSEDLNKTYLTSWLKFSDYKGMAYSADQNSTTHAVRGPVESTEIAENSFDEITYEKGSSIVKQMYYYIGDEAFSSGLKSYFAQYKWGNTIFDNFVDKMVEATNGKISDLKDLCYNWLQKPGLNEVSLTISADSTNHISKFIVHNKPCNEQFPSLQTHIVDFLFVYDFKDQSKNKVFTKKTILPKPETEFDFSGELVPKFVFLNHNDWGYLKLICDHDNVRILKENLPGSKDELFKSVILRSLFDSCRDAKISGIELLEICMECLKQETNEQIINTLLRYINSALASYIPLKYIQKYKQICFKFIKDYFNSLLEKIDFPLDIAKRVLIQIRSLATTEEDYKYCISLLNLDPKILDQETRFYLVESVYMSRVIPLAEKEKLLENECKRDKNSNISGEERLVCNALLPDRKNKEEVWRKLTKETNKDSLNNMECLMRGFAPKSQYDLVGDLLKDKFFEVFPEIGKNNESFYVRYFCDYCSPDDFVEDESIFKKMEELLEKIKDMPQAKKYVEESYDLMKRKKKAHLACEEYLKNK